MTLTVEVGLPLMEMVHCGQESAHPGRSGHGVSRALRACRAVRAERGLGQTQADRAARVSRRIRQSRESGGIEYGPVRDRRSWGIPEAFFRTGSSSDRERA